MLQAQDRCHRIGQTREVHIYRLVSESTIEENILHKSDQKRQLDHLAIQSGGFNTDFLQKFNPRELLGIQGTNHFNTLCITSSSYAPVLIYSESCLCTARALGVQILVCSPSLATPSQNTTSTIIVSHAVQPARGMY